MSGFCLSPATLQILTLATPGIPLLPNPNDPRLVVGDPRLACLSAAANKTPSGAYAADVALPGKRPVRLPLEASHTKVGESASAADAMVFPSGEYARLVI